MSIERTADRPSVVNLNEYLDGLYSYAFVLCKNQSDAEELIQKTCLRAIGVTNTLASDSNVKSRIFIILRDIWLNQAQKSRRTLELKQDENRTTDTTRNPHTTCRRIIELDQIRAAIQQLPVDSREIIVLRMYEEFSYEEISAIVGCPIETVMSRLSWARERLRLLLLCADRGAR